MISLRPVLLVNGLLLATLGSAMMLPAMFDLYFENDDWLIFAAAAGLTLFAGGAMAFANIGAQTELSTRQAFLLTTLAWVLITAFSALPLYWSLDISYTDAFFEAMSGLTTTGATVISGLDGMPPGVLIWRAVLQWLGGIGIIVMAIAVLPMLRIGGMQLFKLESSDNSGKILPRARQIANSIAVIYLTLTAACFFGYIIAGMGWFEAFAHALTTVSTGGFSTRDASIGGFDSIQIELVCAVFMTISGLPLLLLSQAWRSDLSLILKHREIQLFFVFLGIFILLAWFSQFELRNPPDIPGVEHTAFEQRWAGLREAYFNVASIMTGTGFATTQYDTWSPFGTMLFLAMMFIGGCAGSTTAGLKVFRFYVLFAMVRERVRSFSQPHRVQVARFNGKPLSPEVARAVMNFFFLFLVVYAVVTVLLSFQGLDPLTAMSAAISALSCVGPGLGPIIGPAGNYASLPDSSKWTLAIAMLVGRLELFTVIVLFTPAFWRS